MERLIPHDHLRADTDTVTLLLRGHAGVKQRVEQDELAITIVTVEEILTGWYSQIRRAKKDDQLLRAYAAMQQAVEFISRIQVLPMDRDALQMFNEFRASKLRLASNDL